jgi:hypothetical protein
MKMSQKQSKTQKEEHGYLKTYREEILDKKAIYFIVMTVQTILNLINSLMRGPLSTLEPAEIIYRFRTTLEGGLTILV